MLFAGYGTEYKMWYRVRSVFHHNTRMLVTFGICLKKHFDTRYLAFYNLSPPRMFLPLNLLSEYRIQHGAIGPLYVTSSNSTWIFCRGVSGFVTDCPCDVWYRWCWLTTCLLHVCSPFGNRLLQDRRWNADKPSAALDSYIPTWLTTSSANHRPANFWKSFFFFLKHWKEIVKSGAISCWTDVDQFQIWRFHSLILEVQIMTNIIYQSIMGMFTYFHSMSLRCSYMIFSVAYLYRLLLRGLISLYTYIYIAIYRVLA